MLSTTDLHSPHTLTNTVYGIGWQWERGTRASDGRAGGKEMGKGARVINYLITSYRLNAIELQIINYFSKLFNYKLQSTIKHT